MRIKTYRPLVMKIGQVLDGHIIDLYYPSFLDKERSKRVYFVNKGKIVRFRTHDEAWEYLKQIAIKERSKEER